MKPETKRAMKRFAIRWLRKLVDFADEHLHAAEVRLRKEPQAVTVETPPDRIPFERWERRQFSGASPRQERGAKHRLSAADFDRRFAR